jgi:type I restriction enzyme S subunit
VQVKPGYRQTELGEIPEDWEVSPLDQFTSLISYGFTNPMPTSESGVYMITAKDINYGRIQWDTARCTTEEAYRTLLTAKSRPRKGDLLLTKDGTLGRLAMVDNRTVCINQSVAILRPNTKAVSQFLKALLESPPYQRRMLEDAGGSTIKHIYITIVNRMPVGVPPTKGEQEAIAGVLNDADALIESLGHVLAKERQVKQGTIQDLLTGKKRLPGFSEEWEVKRLGDVGAITGSGVDKKSRPDEVPVRLVNYMDAYRKDFIHSTDLDHWVTAPAHQARRCAVQKGDVFFTPSSETRDDIANSAVAMEDIPDASYSYHLVRLRLREPWDLHFRAYAFKTRAFFSQAETLCDGNGTRYVISLPKFRSISVKVPPLPEQAAIAGILSNMDAAIAAVEAKLAKACALKQGMVQELLTGRIRLA